MFRVWHHLTRCCLPPAVLQQWHAVLLWQAPVTCGTHTVVPAGSIADLPQHVAAQVAGVKAGHQEVLMQWQDQQQASRDHLHGLQQALGSLTELVTDHLLGVQQVCCLASCY